MDWRGHEIVKSVINDLIKNGSWCGKTHIIKTLYLLKATKQIDIPFDFLLYKHGPYSFDVEDALAVMKSYGAIEGDDLNTGPYGEMLKLGENADYPQKFLKLTDEEHKVISAICKLIDKKDVKALERLATTAWIIDQEGEKDPEKISNRVHELKPHIPKDTVKESYDEIISFLPS